MAIIFWNDQLIILKLKKKKFHLKIYGENEKWSGTKRSQQSRPANWTGTRPDDQLKYKIAHLPTPAFEIAVLAQSASGATDSSTTATTTWIFLV